MTPAPRKSDKKQKQNLEESPSSCECEEPDDEEEKDATPLDEEQLVYTMQCSGIVQGGTIGES